MNPLFELLTDKIDITQVPFSDRGSRLLVYQNPDHNCLYIKLAERLVNYFPGIESYLSRKPYLPELILVNGNGEKLPFKITTKPHVLEFQTDLGKYKLVFQDNHTLCFSLPRHTQCGMRFIINTEKYTKRADGGEF